jgi:hypothetical protein
MGCKVRANDVIMMPPQKYFLNLGLDMVLLNLTQAEEDDEEEEDRLEEEYYDDDHGDSWKYKVKDNEVERDGESIPFSLVPVSIRIAVVLGTSEN